MHLLLGLLAYLAVVVAIGGGATALFWGGEPRERATLARQEARVVGPRIQAWLERRAEGVAFAERERAAALADKERAEAMRAKLASLPEPVPVMQAHPAEDRKAAERERAARARESARESAKREARRRVRQMEAQTAFGFASEPRRPTYPDEFLTRRDRYGY